MFNSVFCPTDADKFELCFVKHVFQLNTTSCFCFNLLTMPPRILAPNGNGRYRCSDLICAVRNGLQVNDIWDEVKALFPVTREFICVGRLP